MPEQAVDDLITTKGCSHIVASWHDWSGKIKWNQHVMEEKFGKAARLGDVIKLVGTAINEDDNTLLAMFRMQARKRSEKPFLAINIWTAAYDICPGAAAEGKSGCVIGVRTGFKILVNWP
jgi:pentafunctional AROM polypeptide